MTDQYDKIHPMSMLGTFVCQRCLQAGLTEEEATHNGDDAWEIDGLSDPVCEHCALCEVEN